MKISILLKSIYRFTTISVKIPAGLLSGEINTMPLKFILKHREIRRAKTDL